MLIFKNQAFFVTPKEFVSGDIEFNVFNSRGELIGTNFMGISMDDTLTEVDRLELEGIIERETMDMEIDLKYLKEYGVIHKDWRNIGFDKEVISKNMENKWNIVKALI